MFPSIPTPALSLESWPVVPGGVPWPCAADGCPRGPPRLGGEKKGRRMDDTLVTGLQYYGAAAGALAALIVSLDLGRKWTGYGFVIFVTSSIALIGWGFLGPEAEGIGAQNLILLAINLLGVYRYLIRKKPVHA